MEQKKVAERKARGSKGKERKIIEMQAFPSTPPPPIFFSLIVKLIDKQWLYSIFHVFGHRNKIRPWSKQTIV